MSSNGGHDEGADGWRLSGRHTREQHRTAFHEAGHVVVAVLEDVEFLEVVVPKEPQPDDALMGSVALATPMEQALGLPRPRRLAHLRVAAAGLVAEHRWRRLSGRPPTFEQWLDGGEIDMHRAYTLARSLAVRRGVAALVRQCWADTWATLTAPPAWCAVRGMADQLLTTGGFRGADARRLARDFLAIGRELEPAGDLGDA